MAPCQKIGQEKKGKYVFVAHHAHRPIRQVNLNESMFATYIYPFHFEVVHGSATGNNGLLTADNPVSRSCQTRHELTDELTNG